MRRTVAFFFFCMVWCRGAGATPPAELNLNYDFKEKVLNIEIVHPTQDPTEHFIRRLTLYKNGEKLQEIYLTKQPHPYRYIQLVPVDLQPQDVIRVKAYCREGGAKAAEWKAASVSDVQNTPTSPDEPLTDSKGY